MLPLRDMLPTRRTPWVTYALILANVVIFLVTVSRPDADFAVVDGEGATIAVDGFEAAIMEWGFVPCELVRQCTPDVIADAATDGTRDYDVAVPHRAVLLTMLSSMFLHGGWLHLGGNMLFLWVFGNNVEDAMGRLRFLVFYLLGGLLAGLAQLAVDPGSEIPNVGASGAIAAVLGGYILLFPRARVLCWLIIPVVLPAVVPLGLWIVLQLRDGAAALGGPLGDGGGVAYWAHVGGFAAGLLLVRAFAQGRRVWDGRTYVWIDEATPQGPFLR